MCRGVRFGDVHLFMTSVMIFWFDVDGVIHVNILTSKLKTIKIRRYFRVIKCVPKTKVSNFLL